MKLQFLVTSAAMILSLVAFGQQPNRDPFNQTLTASQNAPRGTNAALPPGQVEIEIAQQPPWTKTIDIDPADVAAAIAANKLKDTSYVNFYVGRWPMISFIGGMAMGNDSQDLEFFYSEPFKWHSTSLDYVLTDGGKIYGLRARIHPYKAAGAKNTPLRSYLLFLRTDAQPLTDYHPSYIYANGRRIWDYKKDKVQKDGIHVPFSLADPQGDLVIDLVVDQNYTPAVKGLAFRLFYLTYLGDPGVKVDLSNADQNITVSPADKLKKFPFGLFPSGYDFWTNNGPTFADIRKQWKPNFHPDYPTDDVSLSPFIEDAPASGNYHDFMITYGGCNIAGAGATAELFKKNPYLRGALSNLKDPADVKRILAIDPNLKVEWFRENGDSKQFTSIKKNTAAPERTLTINETFPPTLGDYAQYDRGVDLLVLKNEEDPQYNILMAMGRGMGRSCGKPYGFYWEQTHYPFPSIDEKLQTCLLYYFSGASWIGAEAESAPSFSREIVADWVYPYVQALRFAMVHPARGTPIVPIGIVYGHDDVWNIPYNPFGQMDTFRRYISYDNATNTLTCEPSFTKIFPWMPQDKAGQQNWNLAGSVAYFMPHLNEMKGYDLLDVFFPHFGDAFTAHIAHLLTGTPYGPVDFVQLEKSTPEYLKTFGVLALLGKATVNRPELEAKLTQAAQNGTHLILGVQDLLTPQGKIEGKPFGLTFAAAGAQTDGAITGLPEIYNGATPKFSGQIYSAKGEGWQTVASVGNSPLILRKPFDKGMIYIYLGQWITQGADALRPVLANAARRATLAFDHPDDRLEYVAYKKNQGAWIALFNHGAITIGDDRLDPKTWRTQPPEPLFAPPTGPYKGTIEFHLDKLALDSQINYAVYQVIGIDGKAFEQVIAGHQTFELHEIPSTPGDQSLKAAVTFDKRAEYVIAPKGKAKEVFFGKP